MILTEHKRKTVKLTKLVNPWKWAFAILLGLVIAFFMFIFVKVTTPSVDQNRIVEKTEASTDKYADLSVSMNKDQLEAAINYYLKQNQTKNSIKYRFLLDKSAILMGTTKILGAKVSFTLYTKPALDSAGNIVLNAKSVAIGSLNAPPGFVLGYVKNNYDLGRWAKIDSKRSKIILDLNQLTKKQGIKVSGESLNLQTDDIRFNVAIPLDK